MSAIKESIKKKHISTSHIIPLSFLAAIIIGTILLSLPICSKEGVHTDILTALFTATTSVCVTGLVVVDTYSYWSVCGQVVIILLVQLGGLGIITVTSAFMMMTRKKFSLGDRMLLKDSLNLDDDRKLLKFLRRVVIGTFLVEGFGAICFMTEFIPRFGIVKGIWVSVFQSVSAFCNAGMDIAGPDSMISYNSNTFMLSITMLLIVLGGLGYVVWFDILHGLKVGFRKKYNPIKIIKRFPEHTKIVLLLTIILILSGAFVFFFVEYNNPDTFGNMNIFDKFINAMFQSVTLRTAGFATVPQENLTDISCFAGYVLMFIGGSPIGTAGGVKTVTIFLVFMNVVSYISGKNETVVMKKRIPEEHMRKASAVVVVSLTTVILLTILLIATNGVGMKDALYEVVSASATVGLTRSLTFKLNSVGRLIIIIAMYLGRIGPISMAIFFTKRENDSGKIHYPDGKFYVG